jgi:glycosyltransferase involved in cell wall biosynthesis
MLSLIIPTMWQCPAFPYFINLLSQADVVKEIIILDNALGKKYPEQNNKFFTSSKLKIIPLPINVGVSIAWNIGAEIASEENIGILNDDIIFDTSILSSIDSIISNSTDLGAIGGPNPSDIYDGKSSIYFEKVSTLLGGWGTMIFLQKSKYIQIPEELKIFFGDNFLFDAIESDGFQNYKIVNLPYFTSGSETIKALEEKQEIHRDSYYLEEGDLYCYEIAPKMKKWLTHAGT